MPQTLHWSVRNGPTCGPKPQLLAVECLARPRRLLLGKTARRRENRSETQDERGGGAGVQQSRTPTLTSPCSFLRPAMRFVTKKPMLGVLRLGPTAWLGCRRSRRSMMAPSERAAVVAATVATKIALGVGARAFFVGRQASRASRIRIVDLSRGGPSFRS